MVDFDFLRFNYTSIFSRFIKAARKNLESVNFIRQIKPQTFGTRLMLNCLQVHQNIDLFEFLGTYIADFKKLTPQQKKAFIHNIQIIISDLDLVSIEPQVGSKGYLFYKIYEKYEIYY